MKKNIILLALDGARIDYIRKTENFKRLMKKGSLFSNMAAYSPHSIASFHAIFTGLYGKNNGVNSYFGTLNFKETQCKTITEYFKEIGYFCFGDSMNELVIPQKGFDLLKEQEIHEDVTEDHKEIIKKIKEKNDNKIPCFVHMHYSHIHNNLVKNFIKPFKGKDEEFMQERENNKEKYKKYIEECNEYLNLIIPLLEPLLENSLLVVFSDHGSSTGEKSGERAYGTFLYEYSLRTFCLFIERDFFPVKEIKELTRNIDIMPTILERFKIEHDKDKLPVDGTSLIEFISENPKPRTSFSETGGFEGPWPSPKEPNIFCIKTNEWKLIYNKIPGTYELYNLKNDPEEEENLIEKEKEKFEELKKILIENIN